jgi:predicted RNA-binding Zn ribbon-like protein
MGTPPIGVVGEFNALLAGAMSRRQLSIPDLNWVQVAPCSPIEVFDPLVVDAADLLASGHDRLRFCPGCDWLFDDQTKNGRRKWCDMADCGSRAKAHGYYHRHRDTPTAQ